MDMLCSSPWWEANGKKRMPVATGDLGPANSHEEGRGSAASPAESSGKTGGATDVF